jgi:hypothetical protein
MESDSSFYPSESESLGSRFGSNKAKKQKRDNPLGTRGSASFFTFNELTNYLDLIVVDNERIFCPHAPDVNHPVFIESRNINAVGKKCYNTTCAIEVYSDAVEYYYGFVLEKNEKEGLLLAYVFNGNIPFNALVNYNARHKWEDIASAFTLYSFPMNYSDGTELKAFLLNQIAGECLFGKTVSENTRNERDKCFQCLRDGPDLFLPENFVIKRQKELK